MPWSLCRHVERQAQLMGEMMERLGVDPLAAARHQHGASFTQARTNCLLCRSTTECRRWLDGVPGAEHPSLYCPNMPFFEACRRQ